MSAPLRATGTTGVRGRDVVSGVTAFVAFCLVIAGPNLPNPLVPVYAATFGLDPLGQGALFSAYLFTLVLSSIAIMVRSPRPARMRLMFVTSVVLAIFADLAMTVGGTSLPMLFAGRMLSGLSVGIGTGAASAIVLVALGPRARTLAGSAVMIGALVGILGGGALSTFLPPVTASSYLLHAVLCALVGIAVVATTARGRISAALVASSDEPATPAPPTHDPLRRRHRVAGYVLGTSSWLAAGVVIALLPTAVRAGEAMTLLGAVTPTCIFLAAAAAAQQIARPHLKRLRAWHLAFPLAATFVLLGGALQAGTTVGVALAALLAGAAQGPAYTLGLATVTYGLAPRRQAVISSRYAAVSYGGCAIGVLGAGAIAASSPAGIPSAFYVTAGACALFGTVAAVAAGARQDLRFVS